VGVVDHPADLLVPVGPPVLRLRPVPWAGDVHLDLLLPGLLVATGLLPAVRQILLAATGFLPVRRIRLVPQSPVVQKDQ